MLGASDAYDHARDCFREYRFGEAERACRETLRLDPSHAGALMLLAEIALAAGGEPLAVMLAERVLQQRPDDADARRLLGRALISLGQPAEALDALAVDDHAERADALADLGDDDAGETFAAAVAADPHELTRHVRSATRIAAAGRTDAAVRVLRRGLALQPGDPELEHLQAALAGAPLPRASDAYVIRHFDSFAPTFDERLGEIGYSLPRLVPDVLAEALAERRVAVLDAGCGTGLLAPGLRPLASRLLGVDLSPGMLARAAATALYDELVERELVSWLSETTERFGAAVAADVLIYFGDIEELLAGFARVVEHGGVLVLSIETAGHGGNRLTPSGRFDHDPSYVDSVLAASGFAAVAHVGCGIRVQAGEPVPGMIVTARRVAA